MAATADLAPGQARISLHRLRALGWLLVAECQPKAGSGMLHWLARKALKTYPNPRTYALLGRGTPYVADGVMFEVEQTPNENTQMCPLGPVTATLRAAWRRGVSAEELARLYR